MLSIDTTIVNSNFKFGEAIYKTFADEKKFLLKISDVENFEKYKII